MSDREHTFATDGSQRLVVTYPDFCSPLDYIVARSSQLRALNYLMVAGADAIGELSDELRADLLWLSQMLSAEIADAVGQFGLARQHGFE